ncbi:MAG: hypothetical protein AAF311_14815 [Pseudomonadota bacterium]
MADAMWCRLDQGATAVGTLHSSLKSEPKGRAKDAGRVAMVIPVRSGLDYLSMLTGQGS